jgi:acyl carrier protein
MAQPAQAEVVTELVDAQIRALPHRSAPPVPPRTPHEETMVAIWREILGRPDIGVLDDFFDLDGDSMHAIRVISQIRETYGVSVRAIDFFESPTVETLAAFVAAQAPSERPALVPRPPDAEPVLSFDQQRLWFADQLVPGAAYNVHGRRRLVGALDVPVLEASIRVILNRHEALRTRFPDVDGEPLQVVDELAEDWRLRFVDVSGAGDPLEAAKRLLDEEAMTALDLARGPLFLATLGRLSDTEHVLGITAHHTVCDHGSVAVFTRELAALYRAGGEPDRAGLQPLAIQYRDFAVWQREWLATETIERELGYWREHLDGATAELTLPFAVLPTSPGAVGGRLQCALSAADTATLHDLCRAHDVTPFMALLATFGAVLGRWSGQPDVIIGVPMTGRADISTRNLIGLFFNTLPIRLRLDGEPTFTELLIRARESALGGYANADVPLDLIVRAVRPPRLEGRTPLFQVVLNVVDGARGEAGLVGLVDEPMDAPVTPSKLDFLLTAKEQDGSVQLELEYDAGRYAEARMWALIDAMGALLREAYANPGAAVFDDQPARSAAPETAMEAGQ